MEIIKASAYYEERLSHLFKDYRAFYKKNDGLEVSREFIRERLLKHDSIIFISLIDKEPIGFIQVYPTLSSINVGEVWLINDLYIDEGARGLGVASKLLTKIIDEARSTDVGMIRISTELTNSPALKLYKKLGFEPDNRFQHFNYFVKAN